MHKRTLALFIVSSLPVFVGCQAEQMPEPDASVRYPAQMEVGQDLDVLAVRQGPGLELVNRTPRVYENVTLWLNQQYVGQVERIDIGPGNRLDLTRFTNRHGQSFPVGSALAPDESRPVLTAELVDPTTGQIHRLPVRLTDEWDRVY